MLVGPGKRRAPPARHETLARDLGWLAPASAAPLRRAAQDVPPIIHSAHFYQPNRTTSIYIYCKIYKLPVLGSSWAIARLYRLFQSFLPAVFFTNGAVYSKDLNIASQYRKFVFTPRIWTIEIANSPSSDTQNRWNDPVVSLLAIQSQQNADDERRAPMSGEAPF